MNCKDEYEKLGYKPGEVVGQYHNGVLFDAAVIIAVHENGALDVEIHGRRFGWSVKTCAPLKVIETEAERIVSEVLNGRSEMKPKGFIST